MLAEKFMLFLEALLESDRYPDGSLRVQSMAACSIRVVWSREA